MARSARTRYARRRARNRPLRGIAPISEEQLQNIFAQGRETIRPTRGGMVSDIGARIAESPLARGLGLGPFGASLRDIGTGLPASQIAMAAAGPVALGADIATLGTTGAARQAATNLARQLPRGRTITGQHFAREQWPTLDPTMAGSNPNIMGAERLRTDAPEATHLYDIAAGRRQEAGLGPQVMTAEVPRTLDLSSKPGQKLRQRVRQRLTRDAERTAAGRWAPDVDRGQLATEIEREAVRQGYHGIRDAQGVVKAFYELPVQRRGEVPVGLRGRNLTPQGIARYAQSQPGGFTVNPVTGEVPQTGIASAVRGGEQVLQSPTTEDIARRLTDNPPGPGEYLGGWQGPGGRTYLDRTQIRSPGLGTRLAGERNYQLAQYDLGAGREIPMTLRPAIEGLPRAASQLARNPLIANLRPLASPMQLQAMPGRSTVVRPQRKRFPGIYRDPREIVGESAQNVAPASPNMPRLFGVTRQDLDEMTKTIGERIPQTDVPVHMGTGRGAQHIQQVMKPANIRRLQDVLEVGSQDPRFAGSYGWYNLEPLMQRYTDLFGPEEGLRRFAQFRQLGSGLSPLSDPVTELQRASVAQRAIQQGRPEMFYDVAQLPPARGHMAHRSAHTPAVRRVVEQGQLFPEDYPVMRSPKVRHYDAAKSGVVGFPTMDAHFARSIGLPDVRPLRKVKGERIPDVSSVGEVEYGPLREWYRSKVAGPTGIPASPAQALQWNVFGTSTGVEAPLSAPYLELLSDSIARAAYKQGISPETARDLFVAGKLDL